MLTNDEQRNLIRKALVFRSNPDPYNSLYMGSGATAMVYHAIGLSYGYSGFDEALNNATSQQLEKALEPCQFVIDYMREHGKI